MVVSKPGNHECQPLEPALSQGKGGDRLAFCPQPPPMGLTPGARHPPLDTPSLNKPPYWLSNLAKPEQFVWNIAKPSHFRRKSRSKFIPFVRLSCVFNNIPALNLIKKLFLRTMGPDGVPPVARMGSLPQIHAIPATAGIPSFSG